MLRKQKTGQDLKETHTLGVTLKENGSLLNNPTNKSPLRLTVSLHANIRLWTPAGSQIRSTKIELKEFSPTVIFHHIPNLMFKTVNSESSILCLNLISTTVNQNFSAVCGTTEVLSQLTICTQS